MLGRGDPARKPPRRNTSQRLCFAVSRVDVHGRRSRPASCGAQGRGETAIRNRGNVLSRVLGRLDTIKSVTLRRMKRKIAWSSFTFTCGTVLTSSSMMTRVWSFRLQMTPARALLAVRELVCDAIKQVATWFLMPWSLRTREAMKSHQCGPVK
jgi:hypothetical protein